MVKVLFPVLTNGKPVNDKYSVTFHTTSYRYFYLKYLFSCNEAAATIDQIYLVVYMAVLLGHVQCNDLVIQANVYKSLKND